MILFVLFLTELGVKLSNFVNYFHLFCNKSIEMGHTIMIFWKLRRFSSKCVEMDDKIWIFHFKSIELGVNLWQFWKEFSTNGTIKACSCRNLAMERKRMERMEQGQQMWKPVAPICYGFLRNRRVRANKNLNVRSASVTTTAADCTWLQ